MLAQNFPALRIEHRKSENAAKIVYNRDGLKMAIEADFAVSCIFKPLILLTCVVTFIALRSFSVKNKRYALTICTNQPVRPAGAATLVHEGLWVDPLHAN